MFGRKNKKINKQKRNSDVVRDKKSSKVGTPDYSLLICIVFLLLFGLLMIFSASAVLAFVQKADTFFFFKRQIIWILIGSILGLIVYNIPLGRIRKFTTLLLIIAFSLMIYMIPEAISPVVNEGKKLIEMPFVNTRNGATRWLDFGLFDLQPSEITKFALIIFTATWFSLSDARKKSIESYISKYEKNNAFIYFILQLGYILLPYLVLGFSVLLILMQRDLDTIVIIVMTFIAMYYAAGYKKHHTVLTILALISSIGFGVVAMMAESYRRSRFSAFLQILFQGEPSEISKRGESFQVWNGLIAIGSGGLFGLGYNESRQKLFYLQEAAYTDSIFAVIAEEFGLIGAFVVILAFLYFLSRGLTIAKNAPNKFSALLAVGITSWITIQAFLNISANLAIIPFAGMPLPFFTYGGSNTIMIIIAVALLLNISRYSSMDFSKLQKNRIPARKI